MSPNEVELGLLQQSTISTSPSQGAEGFVAITKSRCAKEKKPVKAKHPRDMCALFKKGGLLLTAMILLLFFTDLPREILHSLWRNESEDCAEWNSSNVNVRVHFVHSLFVIV